MLNFAVAESDFDYLNNFRSTEEGNSRLLLLSRPVPVNKRLSSTKEEFDDFIADLALKLPVKENPRDQSRPTRNTSSSFTPTRMK
jgi:hypothetical protein